MTIFRSVCRCFLFKLLKMSQSVFCNNLKATARWWFSNTDSSLYMRANSEPKQETRGFYRNVFLPTQRVDHTCINKKLIGEAGMIDVVDGGSEDGGHDFQIGKHRLERRRKESISNGENRRIVTTHLSAFYLVVVRI